MVSGPLNPAAHRTFQSVTGHKLPGFPAKALESAVMMLPIALGVIGCADSVSPSGQPEYGLPIGPEDIPSGVPSCVRSLLKQTFSEDPVERAHAAKQLREHPEHAQELVPFLVRIVGDPGIYEPGACVGREVSKTLRHIGEPAVEPLITALSHGEHPHRDMIATMLGAFGGARAVDALVVALNDKDAKVRQWAAWALGEIRDPRGVNPLVWLLEDKEWEVAENAAGALGKIKAPTAVDPLLRLVCDRSQHKYTREAAARALGDIGDPRAFEGLLRIFSNRAESPTLRGSAIWAIGKTKAPRAVEPLLAALQDEVKGVRELVVLGLGDHAAPMCINALIQLVNDESEPANLRAVAACALIRTGNRDGIDAAIATFEGNKDEREIWRPILDLLALSDKPRAYVKAVDALSDENELIQHEAARVFVHTLEFSSFWHMGVTDKDMARSLPALRDPRIVQPLIDLAQNTSVDESTRLYARMALKKTGDPRAAEFLAQQDNTDQSSSKKAEANR